MRKPTDNQILEAYCKPVKCCFNCLHHNQEESVTGRKRLGCVFNIPGYSPDAKCQLYHRGDE